MGPTKEVEYHHKDGTIILSVTSARSATNSNELGLRIVVASAAPNPLPERLRPSADAMRQLRARALEQRSRTRTMGSFIQS